MRERNGSNLSRGQSGKLISSVKLQRLLVVLLFSAGVPCAGAPQLQQSPQQDPAQVPQQNQVQAKLDASTAPGSQQTLATGTTIEVRIADDINSSKDHIGDLITGTVDPSVLVGDHVVIPRGTEAHVRITEDQKGHALGGKAKVRVELSALVLNKRKLDIYSDGYGKDQGALSSKLKGAARAGSGTGTESAAASGTPELAGASPIIAAFTAAKVDIRPGTRIKFVLRSPFTFQVPPNDGTGS